MAFTVTPVRFVVAAVALATLATLLPQADAFAAQSRRKTATEQQTADTPTKPMTRRKATSCAEYGPGFVAVEGTGTCMKIGGSIGVDAGGRVR
jgi:hypothetical protein